MLLCNSAVYVCWEQLYKIIYTNNYMHLECLEIAKTTHNLAAAKIKNTVADV